MYVEIILNGSWFSLPAGSSCLASLERAEQCWRFAGRSSLLCCANTSSLCPEKCDALTCPMQFASLDDRRPRPSVRPLPWKGQNELLHFSIGKQPFLLAS